MCIAIVQLEGIAISKERLRTCYDANDDGCGFAFGRDGKIEMFKTMDFEEFYREYTSAFLANPDSKFLIHFRIGTQGEENVNNCHPFLVNESVAFIHNGIIPKMPKCTVFSDTWYFNENIIKKLPDGWLYSPAIWFLLEQAISFSKLCFLDAATNQVIIINEDSGKWDEDGNWYSNNSFQPKKSYKNPYYDSHTKREDWAKEWWVGSQKRCYVSGRLCGWDYTTCRWRPISAVGSYLYAEDDIRNYTVLNSLPPKEEKKLVDVDVQIMEECEMCPGHFPREEMSLAKFQEDSLGETFWMCDTCKITLVDYIENGLVIVLGEA